MIEVLVLVGVAGSWQVCFLADAFRHVLLEEGLRCLMLPIEVSYGLL